VLVMLIWVGIIISHLKDIKYVFWSFIPIQLWVLDVILAYESTLYIEEINERSFQMCTTILAF
jgi:hypothetical protein